MTYGIEDVRQAAATFGYELTDEEARTLAENAREFERAARAVDVRDRSTGTAATDVRPGEDQFNAFHYRCTLGGGDGPLSDLQVGVKDNVAIAGVPMTCGSEAVEYTPDRSATVVERLVDAGAEVVGATNMDDFAYGSTGEYCAHGRVVNPRAEGHIPGGSSSGSAAAVAAGLADACLGSDTGGSIRMPAAFSGVVGIKPTHRSVSRDGFVDLAPSLDHVGTLAGSVETAGRVLEIMNGPDVRDPSTLGTEPPTAIADAAGRPVDGLSVGVIEEGMAVADGPVRGRVAEAVDALEAAGVEAERVPVPTMEGMLPLFAHVTGAEFSTLLAANGIVYDTGNGCQEGLRAALAEANERGEYGQRVREMAIINRLLVAETGGELYLRTRRLRQQLFEEVSGALAEHDVLVCPTMAMTPPEYGRLGETDSAPRTLANTAPFDLTGHPAISVPFGGVDGLPVGVQVVAEWHGEPTAVRVAAALESAAPPLA